MAHGGLASRPRPLVLHHYPSLPQLAHLCLASAAFQQDPGAVFAQPGGAGAVVVVGLDVSGGALASVPSVLVWPAAAREPAAPVGATEMAISGVEPPDEVIGAVAVTLLTPPPPLNWVNVSALVPRVIGSSVVRV